MTLRDEVIEKLIKAKIPSPRMESDILIRFAVPNYPSITQKEKENLATLIKRRINHEPLDKIIGYKEFYKWEFIVSSDVLSPRPDTEILVETALEYIPQDKPSYILDMGTGSGCIILSLLKEREQATGMGIDISSEALEIAMKNAKKLNLASRIKFLNTDWNNLPLTTEQFDIIVSNPPYIPTLEIETLEQEVKNYDPKIALDGGKDGLSCYRQIAEIAPKIMKNGAYMFLEVGYNQAEDVKNIFVSKGLHHKDTIPDLSGINRCVILEK